MADGLMATASIVCWYDRQHFSFTSDIPHTLVRVPSRKHGAHSNRIKGGGFIYEGSNYKLYGAKGALRSSRDLETTALLFRHGAWRAGWGKSAMTRNSNILSVGNTASLRQLCRERDGEMYPAPVSSCSLISCQGPHWSNPTRAHCLGPNRPVPWCREQGAELEGQMKSFQHPP